MMIKNVVIAGAGQAAAWVARTLRAEGFLGGIVMCGAESDPPYERPPLSKEQLMPGAADMPYLIRPDEFPALALDWKPATSVDYIDRVARTVTLSSGESLAYDALVIATGGRAHLPQIPGFDLDCVHTLRTLGDAHRLRSCLHPGKRILVVGGGWIGLEVAATASQAGSTVTLVEMGSGLCTRTGIQALSSYLYDLHVSQGVRVCLNTQLARLASRHGGGCVAYFADGSQLEADVVVVGAGLVPNDDIAVEAGLDCDRGVLVDAAGRSSDPFIFAAGDVAVLRTQDGRKLRLESWQNAQDQGMAVARTLMGALTNYEPQPFFWSVQYDVLIQMAGNPQAAQAWIVRDGTGPQQTHIGLDGLGRAVYGLCIGAPRDIRSLRRFIVDGTPLDRALLADATVPLAKTAAIT